MKLILLIILTTNLTFAQNSVILEKGDLAPYDGILLTPERAEEAVKAERKLVTMKALGEAQEALTAFHKEEAVVARKRLSEAKWDGFWSNTMYFALGVVITSVAFKVNQEIGEL